MSPSQQTLLQTDVVDSTRLSEQLGDAAMSALWTAHDRVARDLLRDWRGREIDKSDGFLLLFADTADAVGYALAYHRAIAALAVPLSARAGLHVGPVITRQNSPTDVALGAKPLEVEGVAKPITARVMSLAAGGQTLVTAEAKAALADAPLRLEGHGHWRIKGIEEPIELFEVAAADASFAAPPVSTKGYRVVRRNDLWMPLREVRHSLPTERDAFVNRLGAMRDLADRFASGARLISVLGTAGTGKSRLAQRFGWAWLGDYVGGLWFCDLSQARSLDGIAHAVAQGLDVPLGDADPMAQLGSALAGRGACLVILDNFEQVSRHAEATLGQWLNRTSDARFIVTTREVLGIPGEQTLQLAPLALTDSATLFMRRAVAARPDFDPSTEDRAAIAPLVKLLDGLPLAIELAAARVRVMPPRMLLKRMSQRFKLLASTGGRPDRQATLRAAFDWSWELLSPAEKAALAQLSVFEGGFTLAAAEAVLDLSTCEAVPWAIDVVQSLVEKSFVRQATDQRFDLLGSVLDYAAEHLRTEGRFGGSGPAALAAAHARHWRYFAGLDERQAVADGCVEIDNFVVACRRAAAQGDGVSAVSALTGAWAGFKLRGPFSGAVDLAAQVRRMTTLTTAERATVEWVAGSALRMLGREDQAQVCFHTGIQLARDAGDIRREAHLLCASGQQHTMQGRTDPALAELTQSLELARRLADRSLEINALNTLASLANNTGHSDDARALYEEALVLARNGEDRRWQGGLLGNLGTLHHVQGRLDDARTHYEQALQVALDLGDRQWAGNTRCNLGLVHLDQGRTAEARTQFEAVLATARELGYVRLECVVLCNLGLMAESEALYAEALQLQQQAFVIALAVADRSSEGEIRGYLGLLLARVGRRVEAREHFAVGEQLLRAASAVTNLGMLHCRRAEAELLAGHADLGRAALDEAQRLAAEARVQADSDLGKRLSRVQLLFK